mgnify:FL=1
MPKRTSDDPHPFQALEESAYQAFREWPVWLVLRERELDAHLSTRRPAAAAGAGPSSEQPGGDTPLDQGGK